MTEIVIESRFHGPPSSGNGGYVCGAVAEVVGAPTTEVTLRRPPPLDTPMSLKREHDIVTLLDGGEVVAEGGPAELAETPPPPPSFAEAVEAARGYLGFRYHAFPTCFVCGPDREERDGLRLFVGPRREGGAAAGPWIPDASVCDEGGRVGLRVMHAALDCPSAWGGAAVQEGEGIPVLGRLTATVLGRARAGERCVALGWPLGRERRKVFAGSAIYGEDDRLLAMARATWILIDAPLS